MWPLGKRPIEIDYVTIAAFTGQSELREHLLRRIDTAGIKLSLSQLQLHSSPAFQKHPFDDMS